MFAVFSKLNPMQRNCVGLQITLSLLLIFLSFSNLAHAQYCVSSGTCGNAAIKRVDVLGDNGSAIANSSICSGYSNFTKLQVEMSLAGAPYILTMATTTLTGNAYAYVDWNQDRDFSDPGEDYSTVITNGPVNFAITPPANALPGLKRLRLITNGGITVSYPPPPNGCGVRGTPGETEDYTIFLNSVLAPIPSCVPVGATPTNNSSICLATDSIRWSAAANADGYLFSLFEGGTTLVNKDTVRGTSHVLKPFITNNKAYKWIALPYNSDGKALGCDTLTFKTYPNPDPIADVLPAFQTSVCQNAVFSLDGNPSLGSTPYTHSWNGARNVLLSDTAVVKPAYNTSTPGTNSFTYTVTDANGCSAKDSIYVTVKEGPAYTQVIAIPQEICTGGDVSLQIKDKRGSVSWTVSPSGAIGSYNAITLNYLNDSTDFTTMNTAGRFFFKGLLDYNGCSKLTDTVQVIVKQTPDKPLISPENVMLCEGQSATITTTNFTSGITWDDDLATANRSLVVSKEGFYVATANIAGCTSSSDPVEVTIRPVPAIPTIQVIGKNPACPGETVELKSSSATNNTWSTGESAQSIFITSTGIVRVTVGNSFGCSSNSLVETVEFNAPPLKPIISTSATGPICDGKSIILTSSHNGSNTWSTGETTKTIAASASGNYSVTAYNTTRCTSTSTAYNLVVYPLPAKPSISQTPPGPVCVGSTVELRSSSAQAYRWNTGSAVDKITVSNSGDYAVSISDANGCENTSAVYKLIFNPIPAKPTISASSILCIGSPADLTSSAVGNNLWSNGSMNQSISITTDGDYAVTFTDNKGCLNTSDVFRAVFNQVPAAPTITQSADTLTANGVGVRYQWYDSNGPLAGVNSSRYVPTVTGEYFVTVISAQGCESDQSMGLWFSGTGIFNRPASQQLKIYPNPSNGQFEVVLPAASTGQWTLLDISGRVVKQQHFNGSKLNISETLSKGVYLLQVTVGDTAFIQRVEVN